MIKDFLYQIKYAIPRISFNRKKKIEDRLSESFGQIKTDSFDFQFIEKYYRNKDNSNVYHVLSDKTCNDLDFEDLFMFLDRTNSKVGQQYLYNKLRAIQLDENQTKQNEYLISKLTGDSKLRISVQKKLEKLKHKDAYYIATLFQEALLEPPKWFFVVKLLSFTSVVVLLLSFFYPLFFIALIGVFCVNFVLHHWNKNNLMQYVSSIPQLFILNNLAAQMYADPIFKEINPELPKSIGTINQVKRRMAFFQLEVKLQGDFEIIAWFIFELVKTLFLLEPLLLFGVLKRLNSKRKEIEDVYKFVGHIDMLVSIASLRAGLDSYCIPKITEKNEIIAEKLRHPLIFNCTENSIRISEKSILLTGSNMSGKTSFIRAIGINVITGLTLNTCFAESMSFPLLKVFSAIRINDDLMNDRSYYFEEVLTIKDMISESGKGNRNLFLLDEIFKGTNTVERISAGKAVLSALNGERNTVLVATHDIELTDMLNEEYELYHFSESLSDMSIGFDYKLKIGSLKNRNAIRILEINGYPKEVIHEATKIATELDENYLKSMPKPNDT